MTRRPLAPIPLLLAVALVAAPVAQSGPISSGGESPRLTRLAHDLAEHVPNALDTFWAEVARNHTPIVEPVPGDPSRVRLTFVWRGDADTTGVQLFFNDMQRLADTDVWYSTLTMPANHRLSYRFTPITRGQPPGDGVPDPLNPHRFMAPVDEERPASAIDPSTMEMRNSIVVLPEAPASPYVDVRPGVARGRVETADVNSRVFGGPRRMWIYTPPLAAGMEPAGVVICLWARDYLSVIPVPTILDNLQAEHRLPPVAAVFIDAGDDRFQNFQSTEMFTRSFAEELMPWIRARVKAAADPGRTVLAGYSASGLESAYIAYAHPELVGRVLTQSGAFWRGFEGTGASEPEWLTSHWPRLPLRPTRIVLDVGGDETHSPVSGGVTFKDAVAHLRDALTTRGYAVSYVEVPGGEHEFIHWRTTFADDLLWLTADWRPATSPATR